MSGFNNGNGNGNNGVDPEVLKSLKLGSSVYRSQKCGDIDESWVSKEIVLSGWLSAKRYDYYNYALNDQ